MKTIITSVITTLLLFVGISFLVGTTPEPKIENTEPTTEAETSTVSKVAVRAPGDQYISPPPLPDYLTFAGEEIPLHKWDVRERLDRELLVNSYYHSSTVRMLKLTQRYLPMIENILAEHGVHDDMKFIALAESGLVNSAISSASATGPWQFMKSAGKQYGLEVKSKYNTEIDERYHWEKATHAAAKYLKAEKKALGTWALAAAAYNAGAGRIRGSMKDQLVDNYYDLLLNSETSRYVFRVIAIKEIYNNPERYGFHLDSSIKYDPIPTKEIEVSSISNIASYAKSLGTNYKEFKLLNPWLRSNKLTARKSGKKYLVKIPYN